MCTSWGIAGKRLYLIDVVRERFDYPELKRRVKDEHRRWRADVVLIEDKASGTQLNQELLDEGMHAATRYRPQADKIMRIYAQTAVSGLDPGIENGFVHLPEAAPPPSPLFEELADVMPFTPSGEPTSCTAGKPRHAEPPGSALRAERR